jgi:hypothetical protein
MIKTYLLELEILFFMVIFTYEIVKLEEPQKLFGQVDHDFEIKALCKKTRKGVFDAT